MFEHDPHDDEALDWKTMHTASAPSEAAPPHGWQKVHTMHRGMMVTGVFRRRDTPITGPITPHELDQLLLAYHDAGAVQLPLRVRLSILVAQFWYEWRDQTDYVMHYLRWRFHAARRTPTLDSDDHSD